MVVAREIAMDEREEEEAKQTSQANKLDDEDVTKRRTQIQDLIKSLKDDLSSEEDEDQKVKIQRMIKEERAKMLALTEGANEPDGKPKADNTKKADREEALKDWIKSLRKEELELFGGQEPKKKKARAKKAASVKDEGHDDKSGPAVPPKSNANAAGGGRNDSKRKTAPDDEAQRQQEAEAKKKKALKNLQKQASVSRLCCGFSSRLSPLLFPFSVQSTKEER